ncbi:LysR family transcriptional regulator [Silvibacterium acidisoli]|uniref:LysR family transcriptional regulator n=1 Tax=Acidobacteriaceae bacterium ZG23-2 TaxID=2883246 RepID=UPI00406C3B4F
MRYNTIEQLDLDLLIALDALLRLGNVSQAAQELGVSQPALSSRLSRLRKLFADKLFVPATSGRGIVATPRAEALRLQLAGVLSQLHAMVSSPESFEPLRSEKSFILGLHQNPAAMVAPDLVPYVMALAPNIRLAFTWPPGEQIVEQLEAGTIDLVLGADFPLHGDLISRTLLEEPLMTAQRVGHPRGSEVMDIDAFCDYPHLVASESGASFSDSIDERLAAQGRSRKVVASISRYAVIPRVVEKSDCLCTLPKSFLERYGETLELFQPPVELEPARLCAYWHPRSHDDSAHIWLRAVISDLLAGKGIER